MSTIQHTAPKTSHSGPRADDSTLNHYVNKAHITESIVTGAKVPALCGFRFTINGQGNGDASEPGAPICALCALVHDAMRKA